MLWVFSSTRFSIFFRHSLWPYDQVLPSSFSDRVDDDLQKTHLLVAVLGEAVPLSQLRKEGPCFGVPIKAKVIVVRCKID